MLYLSDAHALVMNTSTSFHLKKATITDATVLADIGAATFYNTFRPHNSEEDMQLYINKTYLPAIVAQHLTNPNIHYYLCLENQQPVGYIKLIHNNTFDGLSGRTIELEKIYVLHHYFGTNAGKLLMEQAITHSKTYDFNTLFLGVWKENERAVKFYEKNAFRVFAHRTFQLGQRLCEDYMMRLDL
ncbi:MAG: GNAT family N-acetyltransferase [Bacteroidetes bacterium]|nr:MAG: GNAT family N-acetyltransferase [Bacteroidota bacterium]